MNMQNLKQRIFNKEEDKILKECSLYSYEYLEDYQDFYDYETRLIYAKEFDLTVKSQTLYYSLFLFSIEDFWKYWNKFKILRAFI